MTDQTFTLTIAAPTGGSTPAWVNSLTAGAQTILAPSGAASIRDVTPIEWLADSSQTRNLTVAYSGGIGDPTNRLLYVHGGGHGDSKLNALYAFNFTGTTAPLGWQCLAQPSSLADATTGYNTGFGLETLADGKPCAIHSYDQLWVDPTNNRFYRTHGSRSGGGGDATSLTWYWNGTTWINPGVVHNAPLGGDLDWISVSNPVARKTLLARVNYAYFYRWDSGWSSLKDVGGTGNLGRAGGFVIRHDGSSHANNRYTEALAMSSGGGLGNTFPKATIDWTAETVSSSTTGLTTTSLAGLYPTGFYEAAADSYWLIMPVTGAGGAMSGLYWKVNASTFAVTQYGSGTLDAYPSGSSAVHHYKRYCFVPEWRTVVYCTDQGRVFALKLPA
jgi:hypothetical protein